MWQRVLRNHWNLPVLALATAAGDVCFRVLRVDCIDMYGFLAFLVGAWPWSVVTGSQSSHQSILGVIAIGFPGFLLYDWGKPSECSVENGRTGLQTAKRLRWAIPYTGPVWGKEGKMCFVIVRMESWEGAYLDLNWRRERERIVNQDQLHKHLNK